MANEAIRREAHDKGVKLWEIADRLHINDGNFSRRLRKELPEAETAHIIGIIKEIAEAR